MMRCIASSTMPCRSESVLRISTANQRDCSFEKTKEISDNIGKLSGSRGEDSLKTGRDVYRHRQAAEFGKGRMISSSSRLTSIYSGCGAVW